MGELPYYPYVCEGCKNGFWVYQNFCEECGGGVCANPNFGAKTQKAKKMCTCGKKNNNDANFCINCGKKF